ncbi:hypothetical protein JQC72_04780 [Polycladomyces sp. WAk]|uniref:Uncharacterized protein n=1 Tax=Polycladomyces zharkentensis TaxID=2807616 RepID=A0ABS2WH45_9BACL|nr:hypothetical protein [Polycladomyces sp. WAk]MBN2908838.1 hypothetical protein [Polycladomyces sp. WAk]
MKKKLFFSAIAGVMFFGNTALAATSSATITSSMTGADGAEYYMTGYDTISGANYTSSSNDLYVEAYHTVTGPDELKSSTRLGPGASLNKSINPGNGYFYVHLDPAGAYERGCNGWGKLTD